MALCARPIHLKQASGIVPCGQCRTCRINKARFWTFRLMMEAMNAPATFWTTISYNNDYLPKNYMDLNTGQIFDSTAPDFSTLHPTDIDLFLKRVRKRLPPKTFRFFLCGEYGETTNRPHYHICIFGYGEEILPILEAAWTDPKTKQSMGIIDRKYCGPITSQNARYTAGYTLKKLTNRDDPRLEGRYPEFIRNSKGIGMAFAERYAAALNTPSGRAHIIATGDIPRTVRHDGKNWPIDRYLREKILDILGLKHVLLQKGQERFATEMRSLSRRAELNPKFQKTATISPYLMEQQYISEKAQDIKNAVKRADLHSQRKKL